MQLTQYKEVDNLLDQLSNNIQAILTSNLVGLYIYGSVVWGDFDIEISDIDLLVVTKTDLDVNEFIHLKEMQHFFVQTHKKWNDRLEIVYVPLKALQTFKTKQSKIAIISPGEPFNIKEAGNDWLINWYLVREKSIRLLGPDPKTIIEPISQDEFLIAVKNQALDWYDWIIHTKNSRAYQSYALLTMCRALYALHTGQQTSKKKAALWAQEKFPQWSALIVKAIGWRIDHANRHVDLLTTYSDVEKCVREMIGYIKNYIIGQHHEW